MRIFPPEASEGWTISFIERKSRYWLEASAGLKAAELFEQGVQRAWQWAEPLCANMNETTPLAGLHHPDSRRNPVE